MKRKIAILLSVLMLVTLLLPLSSFAAEDKGLDSVIRIAKAKFNITDSANLKFTYGVNTENGKNVWDLNWNSKDESGKSIQVRIREDGKILYYGTYTYFDYSQKKLPKVSKAEAGKIAEDFIRKIDPKLPSNIRLVDNGPQTSIEYSYYFSFVRIENGIPYYNDSVSVSVNSMTGEVNNYNCSWSEDLVFPAPEKTISVEQAEKAYKEKMGYQPVYRSTYSYPENYSVFAAYVPRYSNSTYGIDAFTGDRLMTGYTHLWYPSNEKQAMDSAAAAPREEPLSPEEQSAVNTASKLLTLEQVEKIARDTAFLKLTPEMKRTNYSMYKEWMLKDSILWTLDFAKEATGDKNMDYRYVSVSLDAKTGEVKSFSISAAPEEGNKTPRYDEAASRAEVEKFLKGFNAAKFGETEYDTVNNNEYLKGMGKEIPTEYQFNYIRKVNGILFPDNRISVQFDAVSGEVRSVSMSWYDLEFPSVDKRLPAETIHNKVFSDVGLELVYRATPLEEKMVKIGGQTVSKPEIKLVYALKQGKQLTYDAISGIVLDDSGKPYKEIKPIEYKDIAGHYAEQQIRVLAEYGIALEGDQFSPDKSITQLDFLTLLSKVFNYYYGPVITSDSSKEDIDSLYSMLIREKIIRPEEKAPASSVTREQSVKFLIRAMKYDPVADIKGIFKTVFKDGDKIDQSLIGYVTIAKGMGIVTGDKDYFRPKALLTRAEAMVMIYNYLQR